MDKEMILKLIGLLLCAENNSPQQATSGSILSPLRVGNKVLIRTVTHYHTGLIEELTNSEVVLSQAAWIADVGRLYNGLSTGELNEVEPFADGIVSVNRGSIVDVANWEHELPKEQR